MTIWSQDYVYVIGEIGINHNGDLDLVKELVDMAARCGCDAVKFQKRTVDIVYSSEDLSSPRESPWGTTTRDQKMGLELGLDDYREIDAYCAKVGIAWSASGWDIQAQKFLQNFDLPFNKVASAMITNHEFLAEVAGERKVTLLSTGMSDIHIVESALNIFKEYSCPVILLHSVSIYPCPEELLNLRAIPEMAAHFGVPVGYSGHESTVAPSVVAVALGARIVERHITKDRAMYGSDQSASLAERGLQDLVDQVRRLPKMLGDGQKRLMPGEDLVANKLRYWN